MRQGDRIGLAIFWTRHVHKFTILQLGLHEKGRGGQPLGDVGIVLLARCSEYFCDLWTCNWSDTASRGYIVLTLASESDSARPLAVCKQFCISLNSTPKTSGRTAFCRQGPAKDSQYI